MTLLSSPPEIDSLPAGNSVAAPSNSIEPASDDDEENDDDDDDDDEDDDDDVEAKRSREWTMPSAL